MTVAEAEAIVESFGHWQEAWYECQAEAGMGAVSMGYDGYDGASLYAIENPRPVADAEVLAARAVLAAAYPPAPVAVAVTADDDLPF